MSNSDVGAKDTSCADFGMAANRTAVAYCYITLDDGKVPDFGVVTNDA